MIYDLEERTANFGENVLDFVKTLKRDVINLSLIKQLIRSATSVGANYCEANQASSRRDFLSKIGICRKEANESKYWLRMLVKTDAKLKERCANLWKESHELVLIFSKIANNTKSRLEI